MTGHLVMATVCRTHVVKPSVIPRVVGAGVKWGAPHGVGAVVREVHARGRAAHLLTLLTPCQLLTKLIAIPILTWRQVHPAVPCTSQPNNQYIVDIIK